ncbi:MAG: tRNA (adenosine(37)-N6)-threonylcarbamoyltransferase complex dimerization subunit type 1 TsaB [bacterium]|jgi:tRNA threonylcarbamoyladenosine biosynthesis protein TsaB|nr:tRNA (adenosine(37)-N6)-threonylcarbamoyltransferase complex dimerization subunit type 1 TsaB [bacterium]
MVLLAIDTSTSTGSVALWGQDSLLGLLTVSVDLAHSEGLMPAVDALLCQTGRTVADLTAVASVSGPGSYTGLRIGIATAQGLAMARGLRCVAVPALEMLAHAFPFTSYVLCPLMPARKDWVYTRLFRWDAGCLKPLTDELNVQPDALVGYIQEPTLFFGPALDLYQPMLHAILEDQFVGAPAVYNYPRADILAALAMRELAADRDCDPALLLPHYLGPSQAELNWAQKRKG